MITQFDDYCIHQTSLPIAQPSQSDRNFYDRYWFNGIEPDGNWIFEIGFGLYPNRSVMDGHFSVSVGDKQYAFHASRRAPLERGETIAGPLSVEVVQPMRKIRVVLSENEHNIECNLLFTAASIAHEEPQNVRSFEGRLTMETSRFTQMGFWEGYFSIDGTRYEVKQAYGTRDKSWGVRTVGEATGGAPDPSIREPGIYWVWNPINFGDVCTQMGTFEDREGNPTQLSADLLPLYSNIDDIPRGEDEGLINMVEVKHNITWNKGTRRAASAQMNYQDKDGNRYEIKMEAMQPFLMLGIGYNHPDWGHAMWKGELATAREQWDLNEINELEYHYLHNHQIVKATMTDSHGKVRNGVGTIESMIVGRHEPSGFKELFDGAK